MLCPVLAMLPLNSTEERNWLLYAPTSLCLTDNRCLVHIFFFLEIKLNLNNWVSCSGAKLFTQKCLKVFYRTEVCKYRVGCSPVLTLFPLKSITESFATTIHGLKAGHLTDRVIQRSKRMILDTLGAGFLGTSTEVFHKASQYSKVRRSKSMLEIKPSTYICVTFNLYFFL